MPKRPLDSGCLVTGPDGLAFEQAGPLRWARVVGADDGARMLSLFYAEADPGKGPEIACGDSEAVLFLLSGRCTLAIGGRAFSVQPHSGAYVGRGESFHFEVPAAGPRARWLLCVCPQRNALDVAGAPSKRFDEALPGRVVAASRQRREATGERYFKLLVGPQTGSREVTQFIGMIPRSRAAEHFHTYEEVICVLSGDGRLWAGAESAPVGPGSMIFLPRRQPHSLECTSAEGMELVGMFYPAGSPAVNYPTT